MPMTAEMRRGVDQIRDQVWEAHNSGDTATGRGHGHLPVEEHGRPWGCRNVSLA